MSRVRQASKHELVAALRDRYWAASRTERSQVLDTVVEATGYHRKYALSLLRHGPPRKRPTLKRRGRPTLYSSEVIAALEVAAEATGWICGKRLVPFLPELVPALEREGALFLSEEVRTALYQVSAATSDRRLARARRDAKPFGLGTTKPGSLLKRQIPIKTYTPWDEQEPGFCEIDLVAHCGTTTAGNYVHTLDVTDIATGWTECVAVANRDQESVRAALEVARGRLLFPLKGIDSDNGSEFINRHLQRYCTRERLTFTRCRPYHKDDQAHVEEKNWHVVRQLIGYDRYEGAEATAQLNRIYALLHLYVNGYLPTMKLIGKEREGAHVHKRYDQARTPYRRALEAGVVSAEQQASFAAALTERGPLTLRRQIERELDRLWDLAVGKKPVAAAATG
jgi:integrase-like protein